MEDYGDERGGRRALTAQERIDKETMQISNPHVVGSGFIQHPPQKPFSNKIIYQPPSVAHLQYPSEFIPDPKPPNPPNTTPSNNIDGGTRGPAGRGGVQQNSDLHPPGDGVVSKTYQAPQLKNQKDTKNGSYRAQGNSDVGMFREEYDQYQYYQEQQRVEPQKNVQDERVFYDQRSSFVSDEDLEPIVRARLQMDQGSQRTTVQNSKGVRNGQYPGGPQQMQPKNNYAPGGAQQNSTYAKQQMNGGVKMMQASFQNEQRNVGGGDMNGGYQRSKMVQGSLQNDKLDNGQQINTNFLRQAPDRQMQQAQVPPSAQMQTQYQGERYSQDMMRQQQASRPQQMVQQQMNQRPQQPPTQMNQRPQQPPSQMMQKPQQPPQMMNQRPQQPPQINQRPQQQQPSQMSQRPPQQQSQMSQRQQQQPPSQMNLRPPQQSQPNQRPAQTNQRPQQPQVNQRQQPHFTQLSAPKQLLNSNNQYYQQQNNINHQVLPQHIQQQRIQQQIKGLTQQPMQYQNNVRQASATTPIQKVMAQQHFNAQQLQQQQKVMRDAKPVVGQNGSSGDLKESDGSKMSRSQAKRNRKKLREQHMRAGTAAKLPAAAQ